MKKILKKPYYEVRCPYCACYFRFELEDFTRNRDLGDSKNYVICPSCGEAIKCRETNILSTIVKVRYNNESNFNEH